jgi:hypothetical protein
MLDYKSALYKKIKYKLIDGTSNEAKEYNAKLIVCELSKLKLYATINISEHDDED